MVISVRDEALFLPRTLAALAAQVDLDGRSFAPVGYETLVLTNNCRDGTAAVARRYAHGHPGLAIQVAERTLLGDQANVGTAWRRLMDEARR